MGFLIECRTCGSQVSSTVKMCPNCGERSPEPYKDRLSAGAKKDNRPPLSESMTIGAGGSPMDFPVLETERLRLRMPTRSDASDLFRYFSLDEVTRYYDLDSFTEIRQAEELIYTWSERYAHREGIRWGIVLKPSPGRVIGTCGYHNWAKAHRKAEIGFELAPEYWRRGLMTEALEAIVGYGFSRMALNRIEAYIDPDNFASRRLLENAGFSEEGYLRDCFFEKGRFADAVLFALIRRDYVEVHP